MKLEASAKQHDFAEESIPRSVPFITEAESLRAGIGEVDGQVGAIAISLQNTTRFASETARETAARLAAGNNLRVRELERELGEAEAELARLRRKNEAWQVTHSILQPVSLHLRSLEKARRDTELGSRKLDFLLSLAKNRHWHRCSALSQEGRATASSVIQLDEETLSLSKRIAPMQRTMETGVAPES